MSPIAIARIMKLSNCFKAKKAYLFFSYKDQVVFRRKMKF